MKVAFLLILITVIGYAIWNMSDVKARKRAAKAITFHGWRIGALLAIIAVLMAAAYYLPASVITI